MKPPIDLCIPGPFRRVWDAWLTGVEDTLFGHGGDLVERLGAAGVVDNVARAQDALRWACDRGVLVRGTNQPTKAQRFFDVNGDNERAGWVTSGYSPGPSPTA